MRKCNLSRDMCQPRMATIENAPALRERGGMVSAEVMKDQSVAWIGYPIRSRMMTGICRVVFVRYSAKPGICVACWV